MPLSAFQAQVRADAAAILAAHGVDAVYTARGAANGGAALVRVTGGELNTDIPVRAHGNQPPSQRRTYRLSAIPAGDGETVVNGVTASKAIANLAEGDTIVVDARAAGVGVSGSVTLRVGKGVRLDEAGLWLAEVYP